MISVITISNRKGGLDLIESSLKIQTHQAFEWVTVGVGGKISEPVSNDLHNLNKCYNLAVKASKGDLLVSVQDFIWFPPSSLQKFWYHFQNNPKSCVSGVGDVYSEIDMVGMPTKPCWRDPRKNDEFSFRECLPVEWELNFSSFPRQAILDIGGFDESYDKKTFGMDNVNVAERMAFAGYKFFLDSTNECRALKHDRVKDWEKKHANKGYHQKVMLEIAQGKRPVKLDYLG